MRGGAKPRGAVVERAFMVLEIGDELGNRARRDLRVHEQKIGKAHQERNGLEVPADVEIQPRIEEGVDRIGAHRAEQQRCSVGRRLGDVACPDAAAGAGLVLDHDRDAGLGLQVLLQDASDQIGGAAGRKRHHDGDLALRPGVLRGSGRCREQESGGKTGKKGANGAHRPASTSNRLEMGVSVFVELVVRVAHGLRLAAAEHYLEVDRPKAVVLIAMNDAGRTGDALPGAEPGSEALAGLVLDETVEEALQDEEHLLDLVGMRSVALPGLYIHDREREILGRDDGRVAVLAGAAGTDEAMLGTLVALDLGILEGRPVRLLLAEAADELLHDLFDRHAHQLRRARVTGNAHGGAPCKSRWDAVTLGFACTTRQRAAADPNSACRASRTRCHTREGVSGSSRGSTQNAASALASALAMTPPTGMMPPSPAPLAPSGLIGEGLSSSAIARMCGKSLAVGRR